MYINFWQKRKKSIYMFINLIGRGLLLSPKPNQDNRKLIKRPWYKYLHKKKKPPFPHKFSKKFFFFKVKWVIALWLAFVARYRNWLNHCCMSCFFFFCEQKVEEMIRTLDNMNFEFDIFSLLFANLFSDFYWIGEVSSRGIRRKSFQEREFWVVVEALLIDEWVFGEFEWSLFVLWAILMSLKF